MAMSTPMNQSTRLAAVSLLAILLTHGCAFRRPIADNVVAFNRAAGKATDELVLLNVLRSKDRLPMHFTAVSLLRGNISGTVSSGSSIPFGGAAPSLVTASPTATVKSNPSFDVAVLDTQDFMRGIMAPVNQQTIAYYFEQGWPSKLLAFLLIRKITLSDGTELNNYPGNPCDFLKFKDFIMNHDISIEDGTSSTTYIGAPLSNESRNDLKSLVKATEAKLDVKKIKKKDGTKEYWLSKSTPKPKILRIKKPTNIKKRLEDPMDSNAIAGSKALVRIRIEDASLFLATDEVDLPSSTDGKLEASIRSPEAIIYYLGELARAIEKQEGFVPPKIDTRIGGKIKEWNLFYVRKALPGDYNALLGVKHRGAKYVIPRKSIDIVGPEGSKKDCGSGRTMHCITLVSQLIALQKSSKELPTTSAVTIVSP